MDFGSNGAGETGRASCRHAASRTWATQASGRSRAALSRACRGRWPTGSGRSRSSRRWGEAGSWGSSARRGCSLSAVEQAIDRIQRGSGDSIPYGMNLIHSPGEPELEAAVVDLYLRRRVRLVEASAFLNLTLPVVRYRVAGLRRDELGAGRRAQPRSSPRFRGSKWPPSSWRRRPRRSCESWSPPARSRPSKRSGRREFRWPTTSRPRPIRAAIPTTSRRSCSCRRC